MERVVWWKHPERAVYVDQMRSVREIRQRSDINSEHMVGAAYDISHEDHSRAVRDISVTA